MIPPAMPRSAKLRVARGKNIDYAGDPISENCALGATEIWEIYNSFDPAVGTPGSVRSPEPATSWSTRTTR